MRDFCTSCNHIYEEGIFRDICSYCSGTVFPVLTAEISWLQTKKDRISIPDLDFLDTNNPKKYSPVSSEKKNYRISLDEPSEDQEYEDEDDDARWAKEDEWEEDEEDY